MNKAKKRTSFHPVVISLFIGTALSRIATSMTIPFLAMYLSTHTDMFAAEIGLTVGVSSLSGMLFGFWGGALSDRWGRKRVLLISLFIWSGIFLCFALNPYAYIFILLNLLSGMCKSCFEPVSVALMSDLTPQENRYRVYSIRYIAANAGVAIGPILGAACGFTGGDTAFIITGLFYFTYASVLFLLLHRYQATYGQSERVEAAIGISTASRILMKDKALLWFLGGSILMQIPYSQLSTISPFIEKHFENGIWLFSCLMTANALTVVCVQLPLSMLLETKHPLSSVRLGNILYALGGIGFALANGWWGMIGAMVVFSLGEVLCFPAGNALMDRIAPTNLRGAYFGAQNVKELGRFIGPVFGMPLLAQYGMLSLFALCAILSLLSSHFFWRGIQVRSSEASTVQRQIQPGRTG